MILDLLKNPDLESDYQIGFGNGLKDLFGDWFMELVWNWFGE